MLRLLCLVLSLTLTSFVWADSPRYLNLGLAKAKEDSLDWTAARHLKEMQKYGLTTRATVYMNINGPYDWVYDNYVKPGIVTTLVLIIRDKNEGVNDGVYDQKLINLARRIAADDVPIILRPMHELDASWHIYGMYYPGNTVDSAVMAFKRIVKIFRAANAPVSIDLNLNRKDGRQKVLGDLEYYLPKLTDWIDTVSFSTYNRCGLEADRTTNYSFADEFRPVYERWISQTDIPISIAEVSTSGLCGGRIEWFREMFDSLTTEFTRVEGVTFYFGKLKIGEATNDVPVNWGFDTDKEVNEFRDLVRLYATEPSGSEAEPLGSELIQTVRWSDRALTAPWSIYALYSHSLDETGNPAINPVTGEPFGKTGPVLRAKFSQRFLWETDGGKKFGPGFYLGVVDSPNENQWWNNHTSLGLSVGWYMSQPKGLADWGGYSVELVAERRNYTVDTPARFDGGREDRVELRFGVNLGGDWAR